MTKRDESGKLDTGTMQAAFDRAAHKAVHGTREARSGRFRRVLCAGCDVHAADYPSTLCVGCQAYADHQA